MANVFVQERSRPQLVIREKEVSPCGFLFANPENVPYHRVFGYLPSQKRVKCVVSNFVPIPLIRNSFYHKQIYGKTLPWLENSTLEFPAWSKAGPCCIVPIDSANPFSSKEVEFPFIAGGGTPFKVYGLATLPLVVGGIPTMVHGLLVEDPLPREGSDVDVLDIPSVLVGRRSVQFASTGWKFSKALHALRLHQNNDGETVLEVNIDGCCLSNGIRDATPTGGIGVFFAPDSVYNVSSPVDDPPRVTNLRAELTAAIEALKAIGTLRNTVHFDKALILSDSEYVVEGITYWLERWQANGWRTARGTPVANQDLWKNLSNLMSLRRMRRITLMFQWVPRAGNVAADALAKMAAQPGYHNLPSASEYLPILPDGGQAVSALMRRSKPAGLHGFVMDADACVTVWPKGFKVINLGCVCIRCDEDESL